MPPSACAGPSAPTPSGASSVLRKALNSTCCKVDNQKKKFFQGEKIFFVSKG
jgi:hypothetical protein